MFDQSLDSAGVLGLQVVGFFPEVVARGDHPEKRWQKGPGKSWLADCSFGELLTRCLERAEVPGKGRGVVLSWGHRVL